MKTSRSSTVLGAVAVFVVGAAAAAPGAAAQPADYTGLPVDPNVVTDSTAFIARGPVVNPDGQSGVEAVFDHRDGSRQITDTILMQPDPAAAAASLAGAKPPVNTDIPGGGTQSVAVGDGGTMTTGASPDGLHSITVVQFTQGPAAATIEFSGAPGDPVPSDLAVDYAEQQDSRIKDFGAV